MWSPSESINSLTLRLRLSALRWQRYRTAGLCFSDATPITTQKSSLRMRPRQLTLVTLTVFVMLAAACSSDSNPSSTTPPVSGSNSVSSTVDPALIVAPGKPFPEARCAANRDAGTITYLTGFDFAAASSIIDVITASAAGYYEDLCLDVEILSGFSSANYPLVAAEKAQFASGGSFSEMVAFSIANDVPLVAASVEGRSAIDTLIVKSGTATSLSELAGATIGVKGKLPASIDVMLRGAGLIEGEDFQTTLLDGFDPLAHIALPIDGLPGWKSNEVGALDRAGVGVQLFDPLDFGVPGSFGLIFTTPEFVEAHPTAAQDFVRATMRGLADAVADPAAAAQIAVGLINANGNQNFLSPEGEQFRWDTEAALVFEGTPEGTGLGVPDAIALQAEIDAYSAVGLFGSGNAPVATDYIDVGLAAQVYDDSTLIFP
jgi:ABC-type nitrate/sulfonate/bicarbonate transport system substrate-binding protein